MSDYIKREDALKVIHGLTMYRGTIPFDSVIFNINKIPPADVRENVRGEWIDITAKRKDTGECKEAQQCSVCGTAYLRYYGEEDGFEVVKPNFCPHCGADMRGENHD